MKRITQHLWCALALPGVLAAQSTQELLPDSPLTQVQAAARTPRTVTSPVGAVMPARSTAQQPTEAFDGGAGIQVATEFSDDSIPLPVAAVIEASPLGDKQIEPASGDPFFLGFVAGKHYPPAGERIDPALLAQARSDYRDGRPTPETYAFVMFERRITPARIAQLEALGARVIGFHPHYALRVALPVTAIERVGALDFVHWIGTPRLWQKLHRQLVGELVLAPANRPLDVYISVFDSDMNAASTFTRNGFAQVGAPGNIKALDTTDNVGGEAWMSNGWQQRALQAAGAEVFEYVDSIRAFRARVLPAALEQLTQLDFVQFVESDVVDQLNHDESTPMALSDYGRSTYDGGFNALAVTGVIDSGADLSHEALNHVYWVGWDQSAEGDVTLDNCEHGSHVAGTVLGLPAAARLGYTGNAPGVGGSATLRARFVKWFSGVGCGNSGTSHSTLYSHMRSSFTDGSGNISAKPHAVNNSWGSFAIGWIGSEANARTLDTEVWNYDQLYVFAAGNDGSTASSIGLPGVAKNAFTVASVIDYDDATDGDPGSIRSSSSRGPCGDNRWKPNIAAPGRWIRSVDANSTNGYADKSGTSMAAPHITGIAAQLADHHSFTRYAPQRAASLLMATAMTNNDQVLTSPSSVATDHLNQFGTGRVNAAKAHYGFTDATWSNWGSTLSSGTSTFSDFTVGAGCTRLVVCLTYYEDQSSAGAAQALVNDLDLWIDSPTGGIDPAMNTGEYSAQQSPRDNTEIRILNNAAAGTWRWKVYSDSTTSSVNYSVTVAYIYGDTTPDGTLAVTVSDSYVQPNTDVDITAAAYNPEYFASNVYLDSTSAGDVLQASTTTLEDGAVTDLMTNQSSGRDVTLGTIRPGDTRSAVWTTRWATEGNKSWSVNARSDNWIDKIDSAIVTVDGTQPNAVTNLQSTSHTINVWSNVSSADFTWTAATDNLSGIDGYGESYGTAPGVFVASAKDMEQVTAFTRALPNSATIYFALKSVDNCGNWDADNAEVGPYKVDTVAPVGPGVVTSTTHTAGVQSCTTSVTVQWSAASDALSGVNHYWAVWNTTAIFDPIGGANLSAATTSNTTNIGSSTTARYFHIRALDNAGNYGPTQHFGPVYANAASVSTYCTGKTNSLGCVPAVSWLNQPDKSAGTFTVTCANVLNQQNGLIIWGHSQIAVAFQGGTLCVGSPLVRGPLIGSGGAGSGSSCTGAYNHVFTTAYMNAMGINAGDTLYAQFWMRDPPIASTTGLSNALKFTVCE